MGDVERVAKGLSVLERSLLTGRANGWGSWMTEVGGDLVAQGLGTKVGGSIQFNTPLAVAVRSYLQGQANG